MPGNQLLKRAIDDPATWKRSGNELFKRGFYKIALKFYRRAIELNPGFIEAWNNLGLSFLKIGKLEEARLCNQKVKELKQRSRLVRNTTLTGMTEESRAYQRFRLKTSPSLINDNFWYAFCIAIIAGISLIILTMNNPTINLLQTLGFTWGISILSFFVIFLLLQYVVNPPVK